MRFLQGALMLVLASLYMTGTALAVETSPEATGNMPISIKEVAPFVRQNISFLSEGTTIRAWYYPPASNALARKEGAPAVVMGHGLGMTKDSGLAPYAERFAQAGMHVLVIDYRGFGESDGTPRDIVSVKMQIQDYQAAIAQARSMPGVDPARIALWGASYSGGIVIDIAARDGKIAAVVTLCPNLDNLATGWFHFTRIPLTRSLWVSYAAIADFFDELFSFEPHYIRSIGKPGDDVSAAYVSEESSTQMARIAGPTWTNRLANRDFLHLPPFRPIKNIKKLPCKLLLLVCERDDLVPASVELKAAELAPDKVVMFKYPVNHLGLFLDEYLQDALEKSTAFLQKELQR